MINDTNNINLAGILMDQGANNYNKKFLMEGLHWGMGEGYDIAVRSINTQSREVCLVFSKNRNILDEKCLLQGYVYSYPAQKSSDESDIPIFFTYLDALFTGDEDDVIFLKYTWLRSNNITEIHDGDSLGIFKVTKLGNDSIEMRNERGIDLIPGSRINLIGDLGFVVANSDELRFYPSNKVPVDVTSEVASDITPDIGSIPDTPIVPINATGFIPADTVNKAPSTYLIMTIIIFLVASTILHRQKGE